MTIKKGDMVKVTTGRDKGKSGKVICVYPKDERLLVERVNMVKRHQKPTQSQRQGGIVDKEMPIHISNVIFTEAKEAKPAKTAKKTHSKNA